MGSHKLKKKHLGSNKEAREGYAATFVSAEITFANSLDPDHCS